MTPPLQLDDVLSMAQAAGKRVLALACGDGEVGAALLAAGAAEVVGVDPCARGLTRSRLTAVYQLDAEAAPDLPYPPGYFDVLLVEDLSRLCAPAPTLQHVRRWLADDGRLVCVIPNAMHEEALTGVLIEGRLPPGAGSRPMTPAGALPLLGAAGFKLEDEAIVVRSEPGPTAPAIGAAMAALGVDAATAADALTLVRSIVAGRPGPMGHGPAAAFPDPWHGSRPAKLLLVPGEGEGERWTATLEGLVRGLDGNDRVTIGVAVPAATLARAPAELERIAQGAHLDLVLIEEPADLEGWERLLAGAGFWVTSGKHAAAAHAARRVGTPEQRP